MVLRKVQLPAPGTREEASGCRSVYWASRKHGEEEVASVTIRSGACGFTTVVCADSQDSQNVTLTITSECTTVKTLSELLGSVDSYQEIGAGYDGVIYSAARKTSKGCCAGCMVPTGIFRAMQVAAGLALPSDASVTFDKEQDAER